MKWEQNLTVMVMETSALKPVAAYVSLAGRDPTAPNPSAQRTAGTEATVWMESASALKASLEKTAHLRPALWIAACTASAWVAFASVRMVSLAKIVLRASASITA